MPVEFMFQTRTELADILFGRVQRKMKFHVKFDVLSSKKYRKKWDGHDFRV